MSQPPPPNLIPRHAPVDLSAAQVPHPRPFVCDLAVHASELSSTIEHVSNIEYVRWLDRAAELHADACGYTRAAMLDQGMMWFVARHEIDYLAETWKEDRLIIATWVREFQRVKSWRDYVILRPSDQTVICRASTLWVLVNLQSRRPIRISADMLARFDPLSATAHSPLVDG